MYNCIQSNRRLPDAANRSRFNAVQLKLFYPWILLISDGRVVFKHHTVNRHINSPDLRFFTEISFRIF